MNPEGIFRKAHCIAARTRIFNLCTLPICAPTLARNSTHVLLWTQALVVADSPKLRRQPPVNDGKTTVEQLQRELGHVDGQQQQYLYEEHEGVSSYFNNNASPADDVLASPARSAATFSLFLFAPHR